MSANVGGQPIDTEDSAVVALRFDNGMLGTLTSGYYLDRGYHSLLKIEVRRPVYDHVFLYGFNLFPLRP